MALLLGAAIEAQPLSQARIVSLKSSLTVQRPGRSPQPLQLHDSVSAGDELVTGPKSRAVIRTPDGATVRIFPDSRVVFSDPVPSAPEFLRLFLGSIKIRIEKLSGRPNPHTITTPTAIIAVRGTKFSVFVEKDTSTLVAVDEGVVAVANVQEPSRELLLRHGQKSWIRPGQPPMQAMRFRGRSEHARMSSGQRPGGMEGGMEGGMPGGMRGPVGMGGGSRGMGGMGRRR